MNLDKKLAKYAKQIKNPKYYGKILDILNKADETNYQFKDFSLYDLEYLTGEIASYYDAIQTDEDDRRMIKYCNSLWFIISDKKYILWETESLFIALGFMIRAYFLMFFVKLSQLINPAKAFDTHNVNWDMYLIRGGLKAAEFFDCEIDEVEERRIEIEI